MGLGVRFSPSVLASEQAMHPSERRDIREKGAWAVFLFVHSGSDGDAELFCIPLNHDGDQRVQPSHTVMLALGGAVLDLTLASYA